MERGGAAVVVPDGELSAARLARETATLLADPQRMRAMAAALGGSRPVRGGGAKSCWSGGAVSWYPLPRGGRPQVHRRAQRPGRRRGA